MTFRYYLKFFGTRTAFCRIIAGEVTLAGHRTAFAHIVRMQHAFVKILNRTILTAASNGV